MCQLCDASLCLPEAEVEFVAVGVNDLLAALFPPSPYDGEVASDSYPRIDGDFTVIGPECFTRTDDPSVVGYKGENYYRDSAPTCEGADDMSSDPYTEVYAAETVGRIAAIDKLTAIVETSSDVETVLEAAALLLQR